MAKAVLKALIDFKAGCGDYKVGDNIDVADTATWPEGSLERRLTNGFVVYAVAEEEPIVEKKEKKERVKPVEVKLPE